MYKIYGAILAENGKIKRRSRMSSSMRLPLPKPSFLRNDSMSEINFTAVPVRPCAKCGAADRSKTGACKFCNKLRDAARYAANSEKERARAAAYRAANPDKAKASVAAYRAKNSDKIKATETAYRAANSDKIKASQAAWRAENPEKAKALTAAWRAANTDKVTATSEAYRAANTEKIAIRMAVYRAANPEKTKAQFLAWVAANPEKARSRGAAYRAANPDKAKASVAAWRAENPEKAKALTAAWRAENPEAVRIHNQNRRAIKKSAGGKLSRGLAKKLFKFQQGKCPCCGLPLGDDYHLDHIQPLALGGANEDWNMQLLRKRCNLQKHAAHPIDFMQSRGFLL